MESPIRRRAAEHPGEMALADGRVRWGWHEVDELCNRTANALDGTDLGDARRIAVFAENSAEACLAYVGGLLGGASTVPVNFHLTASEVEYILRDSGASALFVGPETMETGLRAARAAGVTTVIGWRCPATEGLLDWTRWLGEADPAASRPDIVPRPSLLYTSGTSGLPKGAETPPTMFPATATATVAEHVEQLRAVNRLAKFGRHLVVSPMYHSGPLAGARVLVTGRPLTVLGRFDAEATLAAIEADRVETTIMVPTHFIRLLALPEATRRRYDLSSLRYVPHTGSKCPAWVKRAMIDWWGPVFWDRYGATEVGATNEISSEEWLARPGSVGRSIPPFEVVVLDPRGRPLPPMTEGRLFFTDSTGRGIVYHNDPAKSAAAHIAPGVFTIGDMGYVDDDGYVFITDRSSDMVISGGVNIYPAETEHVLTEHPDVADVACIGVPDGEMGEVLKALVVPLDPANPPDGTALIAWCRGRIAHYKCPRSVDIVTTIGRTAMGKVDKRALRQGYCPPAATAGGPGAPSDSGGSPTTAGSQRQ